MKFSSKKFKKGAFSFQGYTPYSIVKEKETQTPAYKAPKRNFLQKLFARKPQTPTQITSDKYIIQCGPLKSNQSNVMDLLPNLPANDLDPTTRKIVEDKWMPNPQLSVFDNKNKSSLTAAEATQKHHDHPRWLPIYYQNPMQSYDYLVYESLYKNTIIGPVMTQFVKFIMGTGFKPELELRQPSNNAEQDKKDIESDHQIIDDLLFVDRCITEKTDEKGSDLPFKMKVQNLLLNTHVFNRACAIKTYDEKNPIVIRETKYPTIPTGYIEFHPRDMGLVKISPITNKMESLQIMQLSYFVNTEDMLYFWNSDFGAPIYLAKYYGGSMLMPMIEPARLIRNQVASILPALSENMAAGLYHIFVAPQGGTAEQKTIEYNSITKATEPGTSNLFMIEPERVKYENVNFDPKISELILMFDAMIKYITASAKLPQIGFYDESAANHATAVEKIQLTISTAINPIRENFGGELARQHYMPIFRTIYAKDKKKLEKYRIKVSWDDLQVETLKERVESIEILQDAGITVDGEKLEEITQIDGLVDHLVKQPEEKQAEEDESREFNMKQQEEATKQNSFKVKDKKTGEKFSVKQK